MPGMPKDRQEQETDNTVQPIQPTLTDRLNKYLLCAYLNRLNEEDSRGGGQQLVREDDTADADTEEAFSNY